MSVFNSFKNKITKAFKGDEDNINYELSETPSEEYLEVTGNYEEPTKNRTNLLVRPFLLQEFEDIKDILTSLREGRTICLINIKPLKDKDLIELKRSINKLKKTCEAIGGDIAGFGDEDWIVVTPKTVDIYKSSQMETVDE